MEYYMQEIFNIYSLKKNQSLTAEQLQSRTLEILERVKKDVEESKITYQLDDDIEISVKINQFNELVIQKQNFGDGETSLIIKPSVSNEIRIS